MSDDEYREAAEKRVRVRLKRARYGYEDLCRECQEDGLQVELYVDESAFLLSIVDEDEEEIARSLVSVYSARALDRAARQVRATLTVNEELERAEREDDLG